MVSDGAQHRLFTGRGVRQQGQTLVAVAGHHDVVEALLGGVGTHQHACLSLAARQTAHFTHGGGQAGVVQPGQYLVDVMFGATAHRVPLGPVAHLDQAMVVAEPDHGGDGEAQHLVGGAGPDAADHGQKVPVPEGVAKPVTVQEVADGLGQITFSTAFGQVGGQAVEAHHFAQHAQEPGPQQIAPLSEDAVQVRPAPFKVAGG